MAPDPTDRELVAAHLGGDRSALGAIYDRYGDQLYDTAAAMLRDRDEAADVVQEVFLVAAQKLEALRDPERLKAWLFAVLRNEVYRRTKRRSRSRPTDFTLPGAGEMVAPTDPRADAADVERHELAELVRAAAAGLDERDQLVMELTLRQDLDGADLAAAVGVTTKQAHVLVHRMRDRLSRSLAAVTVARMGRDDCDELADVLADWDGTFSVLIRKRVARHVDRCETCDETRSKHPAGALFGAAPALAAPAGLRDRVLTAATTGAEPAHEHPLDDDGFPRRPRSVRALTGPGVGLAAVVLVVVALVVGISRTSGDGSVDDVVAGAPTTEASTTTTTTEPSSTSTEPTAPATEPGAPVTPAPGSVTLSTSLVDLGASEPTGSVTLSNPGGEAVEWTLTSDGPSPYVWEAFSGTLGPGSSTALEVSIDRAGLDEGPYSGDFTVAGGESSSAVRVLARVERGPVIGDVVAPTSVSCPSPSDAVLAEVTDESGLASVELRWAGPGAPGSESMLDLGGDRWEGTLDPEPVDGDWTLIVVATDGRDNTSSVSRPFVVTGCGDGSGDSSTP